MSKNPLEKYSDDELLCEVVNRVERRSRNSLTTMNLSLAAKHLDAADRYLKNAKQLGEDKVSPA